LAYADEFLLKELKLDMIMKESMLKNASNSNQKISLDQKRKNILLEIQEELYRKTDFL